MKKILFLLATMCVVSSCTPIVKTCVGDVTAYNADGSVLKKWEGVELSSSSSSSFGSQESSAMKTFGVNFYDNDSKKFIIVGNAVPCIIEYNVQENKYATKSDSASQYEEKLIQAYKASFRELAKARKSLKTVEKGTSEYDELKDKIKIEIRNLEKIEQVYFDTFGTYISVDTFGTYINN